VDQGTDCLPWDVVGLGRGHRKAIEVVWLLSALTSSQVSLRGQESAASHRRVFAASRRDHWRMNPKLWSENRAGTAFESRMEECYDRWETCTESYVSRTSNIEGREA
jgi:hypothetical protein